MSHLQGQTLKMEQIGGSSWSIGTTYLSHLQGQTFKLKQIGCPETSATTNLRCVTLQKSNELIYTAAEA